ncbi:MAG TPA: serine hydrolase [Telluria sp.]|nr:serine hydrolase [Telluria sp.]
MEHTVMPSLISPFSLSRRSLVAAGLALALPALAQIPPRKADLDTSAEELARAALGGKRGYAAVATWHKGKAAYGSASAATDTARAGVPDLYEIGSISKVFTGVLLAQEVEAGRLSLDDSLGKLLGARPDLPPRVAAVTLRQLVTHSACLPRLSPDFERDGPLNMADPYRDYDRARLWASLAKLELAQDPPCAAQYSNYGFALLGELLAERAGKPWEALVRERIAEPLGMRDTQQHLGPKVARFAPAFNGNNAVKPWEFQAYAGAGALRSSAADLLVFGRALMAGRAGPLGGAAERVREPLGKFEGIEIGYALMINGPAGHRYYFHGGATGGYRAYLAFMPDTEDVLAVMASNAQSPTDRIGLDLQEARYPLVASHIEIDPSRLTEYAGVFRINPNSAFTFLPQDGKLYGRLTGQAFAPLSASAPDTFVFPEVAAEFTFKRTGGKVDGVTLRQRGSVMTAALTGEPVPARAVLSEVTQETYGGQYTAVDPKAPLKGFMISVRGGQLFVRPDGQQTLPVFPMAARPDRFASDVVAAEFQFERDSAGLVNALVLHQNGMELRTVRSARQAH